MELVPERAKRRGDERAEECIHPLDDPQRML
jgi:hypothetical protein